MNVTMGTPARIAGRKHTAVARGPLCVSDVAYLRQFVALSAHRKSVVLARCSESLQTRNGTFHAPQKGWILTSRSIHGSRPERCCRSGADECASSRWSVAVVPVRINARFALERCCRSSADKFTRARAGVSRARRGKGVRL